MVDTEFPWEDGADPLNEALDFVKQKGKSTDEVALYMVEEVSKWGVVCCAYVRKREVGSSGEMAEPEL
eukprot:3014711-Pyramimonas_sp.AAC.1